MDRPFRLPDTQRMLREFKFTMLLSCTIDFVLFGVFVSLATAALHRLYHTPTLRRRTFWTLAAFTTASGVCYLGSVVGTTGAAYGITTFRSSPEFSRACASIIATSVTLAGIMSDGLLTYRCWVIWGRSRWVCIPIAILIAEVACFLVQNIQLSLDGIAWETTSAKAALVGLSLNLGLNVMLALAAIARLLRARSELRRAALPAGGQHYVEISRLLAVIAIVYAGAWMPTLILRETLAAIVVSVVLMSVITLSPLLIALQVGERARAHSELASVELPEIALPRSQRVSCDADRRSSQRFSRLFSMVR